MSTLTLEVSAFVRACEALHWRLNDGHSLTEEEQGLIKQAAIELMMRAEAGSGAADGVLSEPSGKVWKRWDGHLEREPHP
jgi:hypothetical protein